MSAGTGVTHSEMNPSPDEPVHLLQIWIRPERDGVEPYYEQKAFPEAERQGRLRLVAAPEGAEGSVKLYQDVRVYDALLAKGDEVAHTLTPERHAWIQVVKGAVSLNGTSLSAGDGAAVSDEVLLTIRADEVSEVLLFDLN
jgi:redox-sensitive bicupin YhaK (pirin superfamily)